MLPLLLSILGVPGTLYFLFRLWWPTWYLDVTYSRKGMSIGAKVMEMLTKGLYLIDAFEESVKKHPQKAFIIHEDVYYTYEYMDKKANQACRTAVEIGVKPGSVIAVMIYNEPAIVWTYLGLMKGGYQIAFMNYNLRGRSLAHSINSSGATTLVVGKGSQLAHNVEEILPDIPNIMVYYMGDLPEPKPAPFLSWDIVMSRVSNAPVDRSIRKHLTPFTPNVLIYTSGTTGLPKPAIVSHARSLTGGVSFAVLDFTADDILYEPLPMYHSAALMLGFANTIVYGATMVLRDKFSASHFWEDCRKYNVTTIQYIGEVCRYLVNRPKSPDDGKHKIKVALGNGLRMDIWEEFQTRFKIPNIVEFYGATECPVGFTNTSNKVGACGRSSPFLRKFTPAAFVKFDIEAQGPYRNKEGRCVPIGPDEIGLLIIPLIEGRTSFQGYRGRQADTEKKMLYDVFEKGDKYFNSGDLIRLDREYYMYFSDRVGDTFRWKGENVSTTEISNMLTDLDFIQDANVYGVLVPGGDGRAGMVSLTLSDQKLDNLSQTMVRALTKHVTDFLPSYARPKFVRVQREFDMTSTFKQQKTALVKEGFDVNVVKDPLYYLNPATQAYEQLDGNAYEQISAGKVHF